jgi:hypothetical protein
MLDIRLAIRDAKESEKKPGGHSPAEVFSGLVKWIEWLLKVDHQRSLKRLNRVP